MTNEKNTDKKNKDKKINIYIGKRIKRRREELGIKQEALANQLGIERPNLSKYETGERAVPIDILKKLSEKLKISIDFLLGLTECKSLDIDNKAIYKRIGLNDTSIEILEEINTFYGGQFLIPLLNFLIEQEKLPPNEIFFEQIYQKIENKNISQAKKEKYIKKVKNIYDRMYEKWKDKNYQPLLSLIEDYYTLQIEGELHITNNSIKRKQDFSSKLDEQTMTRKIIPSEKVVENTYLEEIQLKTKDLKQKYLEGDENIK